MGYQPSVSKTTPTYPAFAAGSNKRKNLMMKPSEYGMMPNALMTSDQKYKPW